MCYMIIKSQETKYEEEAPVHLHWETSILKYFTVFYYRLYNDIIN